MRITFQLYFSDLTPDAQKRLLEKFKTTKDEENWEVEPLAVIERETEEEQE